MSDITGAELAATVLDCMLRNEHILFYANSFGEKYLYVAREQINGEWYVVLRGSLLTPSDTHPRPFRICKKSLDEIVECAGTFYFTGVLMCLIPKSREEWSNHRLRDETMRTIQQTFIQCHVAWDIEPDQVDSQLGTC